MTYKGEYTNKLPHSYDDGKVTKAATIYETGIMTYTCKDCGATRTEIIPLVEKTWHKGDTIAPTCNDKGYTIYAVSYTHLRAHETRHDLVCRLLLEKKKTTNCI